jgi:hypothetical protein
MTKMWNRSSAWSPEQLAELNTLQTKAVNDAVESFALAVTDLGLTDQELQVGIAEVASQVSSRLAEKIEALQH